VNCWAIGIRPLSRTDPAFSAPNARNAKSWGIAPGKVQVVAPALKARNVPDCKLKFEFRSNRLRVTQLNDAGCGFGLNVTAAGAHGKLNRKKPKFDF
jgi:hypothetical protein